MSRSLFECVALLITIGVMGVALYIDYIYSPEFTQLQKCKVYYSGVKYSELFSELQETAHKLGFKSVDDLIEDRCKYWTKNGQKF